MSRLKGKVAIITGAARGIGKATTEVFAKEGAKVVLTDILREEIERIASDINQNGQEAIFAIHDVSSEESWKDVINQTIKHFGYLNVLVNNAGIGGKENTEETTKEQWEKVLSINATSVFLGIKYVVPEMKKSGGGSIINISSIYGIIGTGTSAAYHASKGAIRSLTKTAAVELAKYNIRVNSIHPGVIETFMTKNKLADKETKRLLQEMTPLKYFGKPEDIAYGALYLASDESSFVTGSELVIDGGYTAK